MGAPQYEQAGADIGGTGTTNTIPRWTGASTLGDSGITDNGSTVSFVGRNLASTAAQTWTLNTSLSLLSGVVGFYNSGTDGTYGDAIYIGSASYPTSYRHLIRSSVSATVINSLLKFSLSTGVSTQADVMTLRGDGNVGIGTASPGARLHVLASAAPIATLASSQATQGYIQLNYNTSTTFGYIGNGASVISGGAAGDLGLRSDTGVISFATGGNTERARIDSSGNLILNTANTGATIQAAGSQQGLKLPNAPGNTDPNTLDSYREGTRVLAAGDLSGWTYVTATQYWTLVGRTVTLHTIFTGGTSSATGGATIATPPLLTPLRIAAGAAVNSSGTALGNGVCVVASTSSTTGTVITSNAISSSAVDKVLTVTYETAGL
jgi:hypothetical protein